MEHGQFTNRMTFRIQQTFPGSVVNKVWPHLVEYEKRAKWFPAWQLEPVPEIVAALRDSMIGPNANRDPIRSKVLTATAPSYLKFMWPGCVGEIKLHQNDQTAVLTLTLSHLSADAAVGAASRWHCRLEMLQSAVAGGQIHHPILNDSTFVDDYRVRYNRLH